MPGKGYIEGKAEKTDLSLLTKLMGALVVYTGKTTGDGNIAGTTIVCTDLMTEPDFDTQGIVLLSGSFKGQARTINGSTMGGTAVVGRAFGGQIPTGVDFAILSVGAGGGAGPITLDADDITDNWQAAEADLVSIGAAGANNKIHSLFINMTAINGNLTIRMYHDVNGVDIAIYTQTFSVAGDGPGRWTINGMVAVHGVLRVTCQSDNVLDNGVAIGYDYMLEGM
jgi:hypothetical protein